MTEFTPAVNDLCGFFQRHVVHTKDRTNNMAGFLVIPVNVSDVLCGMERFPREKEIHRLS